MLDPVTLREYINNDPTLAAYAAGGNDLELVNWFAAPHPEARLPLPTIAPDQLQALALAGTLAALAIEDATTRAQAAAAWSLINTAATGVRLPVSITHGLIQQLLASGQSLGLLKSADIIENTTKIATNAEAAFGLGAVVNYDAISAAFAEERVKGVPNAAPKTHDLVVVARDPVFVPVQEVLK